MNEPRKAEKFFLPEPKKFEAQMLQWAHGFSEFIFTTGNDFLDYPHGNFKNQLAIFQNNTRPIVRNHFDSFKKHEQTGERLFFLLGYDLKNEIENLQSIHLPPTGFPQSFFGTPQIYFAIEKNEVSIFTEKKNARELLVEISGVEIHNSNLQEADIVSRMSFDDYREKFYSLKEHILDGNIYEVNLCREFHCENFDVNPVHLFWRLNQIAGAPFAALVKLGDHFLLCESPERFIKTIGRTIISQPMKGTRKRAQGVDDTLLKIDLHSSEKDRAENVMIVDLMRNDLAKCCETGSIEVEELFGIYSFPHLHQMISTIRGRLREGITATEIFGNIFPAGSMTGAPKISAMKLIDDMEQVSRGAFSGTIGYKNESGDIDSCVVIRSMIYDAKKKILSFSTGGAITSESKLEDEYLETELKAQTIINALSK